MKLILIILWGVLIGSVDTENNIYQYDNQGRPIIPSKEELDKLVYYHKSKRYFELINFGLKLYQHLFFRTN